MAQEDPIRVSVKHDGRSIDFELEGSRLFMGGEFAGNVEVDLRCESGLVPILSSALAMLVPGETTGDEILAHGDRPSGVVLVFHSDAVERLEAVPERIDLLWGDERIGALTPVLTDSEPIERHHTLIEPTEILRAPIVPTAGTSRLAANRSLALLVPAVMIFAFGAALTFASDQLGEATRMLRLLAGVALMSVGGVLGLWLALIPHRQVFLAYDRGFVTIVEGRSPSADRALANAGRERSLEEFHHVRLFERQYAATGIDEDEREEWFVDLEGPIPYADSEGFVHRRSDRLELASFASGPHARRFAAEVAYKTGLRILEAGDAPD
jgi:hypothetical protein